MTGNSARMGERHEHVAAAGPLRRRPAGPSAFTARGRPGGVGRSTSLGAEAVSDDLRRGAGSWLDDRRRTVALSLGAMAALAVVEAYQTGLIRRPPEPDLGLLDAARVDAAGEAYQTLRTPDAGLGLLSYALTAVLAGTGDRHRATERPWIPLGLALKAIADAGGALYLTVEQASKHRRFCSWCLLAAAFSVTIVPSTLPEAVAAARSLSRRVLRR